MHEGALAGYVKLTYEQGLTKRDLETRWKSVKGFSDWVLPPVFNYIWVDEILIDLEYRRLGLAARTLTRLKAQQTAPTLIALGPGDIDKKNPTGITGITAFYTSLGFYFQKFGKSTYAFHWTPGIAQNK